MTPDDLLARARELLPLLADEATQGEQDGNITDKAVQALADAELFALATARRYGGHEAGMRTLLDVGSAIGEADGSTSWVLSLCNACALVTRLFPEQAQDEVFGPNPGARISGALAPTATATRVDGGYVVTGRWPYNSGVKHADWTLLGLPLDDGGAGMALVPNSDYRIEVTWLAAGMKATGSDTVAGEDLFIPDHRVVPMSPHFAPQLTLILAAPQLGLGRAALKIVREAASHKPITGTTYSRQADSVAFQLQLAESALKIDTAHLHAYRAADDIDNTADLTPLTRARVRADTGLAVQSIVSAIDTLLTAHGAAALTHPTPLHRIWRDANVALRHAMALPAVNYEIYGKALLDVEPNISPLI